MSHFTLAVFCNHPDEVDGLLAPYDENIIVDRYVCLTKEEIIMDGRKKHENYIKSIQEKLKIPKDNHTYLKSKTTEEIQAQLNKEPSDEEIYAKEITYFEPDEIDESGNICSTYNPLAKWDWHAIGGRWLGSLLVAEGKPSLEGVSGAFDNKPPDKIKKYKWADGAKVKDVEWDKMKQMNLNQIKDSEKRGCNMWDILTNDSYPNRMKYTWDNAEHFIQKYGDYETYLRLSTEWVSFAVLNGNGWHEKGEMGWFGCSSETPDESRNFEESYFENFIAPEMNTEKWIVVVDCHM